MGRSLAAGVAVAGLVVWLTAGPFALGLFSVSAWWLLRRLHGRPARLRRARSRRVLSDAERQELLERDGWACVYCGATDELEIDHIIPFSRGGACSVDNFQVLCGPCNRSKSAT